MFTPTLSRFRIRRDQLLRVFAYGAAGLSWLGLFYLLVAATAIAVPVLTPLFPAALAAGLPTPFFPDVLSGVELLTIRWTPMGYSRLWGVSMPHHLLNVAMPLSILLLGFVWWWRFLFVALRSYLRLNRFDAWALLISTQVIVVLTTMIFVVAAGGHAWTMYLGRLLLH